MAWASTDITPAQVGYTPIFSANLGAVIDAITAKIAPLNSSNVKFDFTGATALSMRCVNAPNLPPMFQNNNTVAPAMVAHDATGLTFTLSASDLNTLGAAAGSQQVPYTLSATDGTTSIIVARGTLNYQTVA